MEDLVTMEKYAASIGRTDSQCYQVDGGAAGGCFPAAMGYNGPVEEQRNGSATAFHHSKSASVRGARLVLKPTVAGRSTSDSVQLAAARGAEAAQGVEEVGSVSTRCRPAITSNSEQ